MRYLFAIFLALFLSCNAEAACIVHGATQDCLFYLDWDWTGDPTKADGFLAQRQLTDGSWKDEITNIPISSRHAEWVALNDDGENNICFRLFAFNSVGMSDPSNTSCAMTAFLDVVTMKTSAIVTTSHRSTDTSSIIAILVNSNTIIGSGGLELTYPSKYTLTVSRRSSNTSSVIAILVNKSTSVIINP